MYQHTNTHKLMSRATRRFSPPPQNIHTYRNHHTLCMCIRIHTTPASTINKHPRPRMCAHMYMQPQAQLSHGRPQHREGSEHGVGKKSILHSHTPPWGRKKEHPVLTDTHARKGWEGKDDTCACSLHPSPCRMLRSNLISCVSNDTFAGLSSVRLLSLYDNRITTITPGAFTTLVSLSTM